MLELRPMHLLRSCIRRNFKHANLNLFRTRWIEQCTNHKNKKPNIICMLLEVAKCVPVNVFNFYPSSIFCKCNLTTPSDPVFHYSDVIMSAMESQITGVAIIYAAVCSGVDQRKHQNSASLVFVRGIHRWIPAQRASNAENVSIWWWRHHVRGLVVGWTTVSLAYL